MSRAWMPLYVGDYLRDTMHLTTEEHGAYLLIIMALWSAGGSLPESAMPATVRVSQRKWSSLRNTLAPFFHVAEGTWSHRRVNRELATAKEKSDKARGSARRRWADAKADAVGYANADASAQADAMRTHMPRQCSSPSQSQKKKDPEGGIDPDTRARETEPPAPVTMPDPPQGLDRRKAKPAHGIGWPVPDTPPPWAAYEAETHRLPAERLAEVYAAWVNDRLAKGLTPFDPVADWRAWLIREERFERDREAKRQASEPKAGESRWAI